MEEGWPFHKYYWRNYISIEKKKEPDEPHTYKNYLKMDYELKYVCNVVLKIYFLTAPCSL